LLRIRLIHWKETEAEEKAERLRSAGYDVAYDPIAPAVLRELKQNPPSAVVIDLSRLPSQGRDMGLAVRHYRATRYVPLVFVDGDPKKVKRIKKHLPDAVYTTWDRIGISLKYAISNPLQDPVAPDSLLDGYSGTPLVKKLGIKQDFVVALVTAPQDFEVTLGKLPSGVTLRRHSRGRPDLTIWFTKSMKDLERRIGRMVNLAERRGLWIAWPKKTSRIKSDLTQVDVRRIGLASGLVDYKVCAIDATWSGLLFTQRKTK
jgi:hypothetical protein